MYQRPDTHYGPEIHEEYLIHPFSCHIIYSHVHCSIAINTAD